MVELQVVVLAVAGSSPVDHPTDDYSAGSHPGTSIGVNIIPLLIYSQVVDNMHSFAMK